jgi:DNA-binding SARP family transcriptional activator/tetratricopeptide (TPR) repeat protein
LRLLAACLALSAGRVVTVGDLIDVLWDDRPPASARASVQILVTRLRKVLAGVPDCTLERHSDGYRLRAGLELVDVHHFRSLCRSARQDESPRQAITAFDQALLLWRGPALADVPGTTRVEAIRSGLAEEHLSAIQDRFGCLLAAGLEARAAVEIPAVLASHPLAERLAGMLMVARYRCGRQAAALQVFRDLRGRLAGELGVEPGSELQRLHQRILSGDPALAATAGPAGEPPPGNGADPAGSQNGPAAVPPRQLPAAPAYFTGRHHELRLLTAQLEAGAAAGPVTLGISGPPGTGKTALALHWAHQVQQRFPDGQLYVNLQGFGPSPAPVTPAEAIGGLLESLGATAGQLSPRLESRAALYRSLLAGQRMLIVLDNARDEAQVRPLLPGSATCVVVITSRTALTGLVAAEGARQLVLDALSEAEARQLLADRIGDARVGAEADAINEMIGLCSCLPLALAIAAARAATHPALPLAFLAAGLQGIRHRLDALDTGDPAASVRAVFSWSYRELSEPAARMFRLLGVHPGPDVCEAAAASLAAVTRPSAQAALSELARANLIQEHTPGRFALHDLLRAYAADLGREDEQRSAIGRVLDHYLSTARAAIAVAYPAARQAGAPPAGPQTAAEPLAGRDHALAWLHAEYRVLLAASAAAADNGFDARAWQLPAALREYFARRGHYPDWAQAQRTALAAAARLDDPVARAQAHHGLGDALIQLEAWKEARAHLDDALALYRHLGSHPGQAGCHCSTARICEARGDYDEALRHARQALRLYRAAGDAAGQAAALNGAGWFNALLGNDQQARGYCGQALDMHRRSGNRFGEAATLDSLGYCCHLAGSYRQATSLYRQALRAYADAGDRYLRAHTLIRLGDTHQASGNTHITREVWQQALVILDDLHHPDADPVRARLLDLLNHPPARGGEREVAEPTAGRRAGDRQPRGC